MTLQHIPARSQIGRFRRPETGGNAVLIVGEGDANAAHQEAAADLVAYGYCTATVVVWDEDPARAEEKVQLVERVINGQGFTTHAEDLNAVEAWLAQGLTASVTLPLPTEGGGKGPVELVVALDHAADHAGVGVRIDPERVTATPK